MKRWIISLCAGAALAIGGSAGAALASNGPSNVNVNAATPGHFSYVDGLVGQVTCNETHHPGDLPAVVTSNVPGATTKGGWDEVQCKIASPYAGSQAGTGGFLEYWTSDFHNAGVAVPPDADANLGLVWLTVNAPGNAEHGFAWYPNN